MKHTIRTALSAGMALLALGTFVSPASAAADTPDGKRWYIGGGDSYGHVTFDDNYGSIDMDTLTLVDHLSPPGTSVRMTVRFGDWKKTVHAYSGDEIRVFLPVSFGNGDTAYFNACGWNGDDRLECRGKTKVVE